MKILISGINGFLGSHLHTYLYKRGHEIYPHNVNVINEGSVHKHIKAFKPDVIYHLASVGSNNISHYTRSNNYLVNVVGTANVVNACINNNIEHLIFTSSNAVYDSFGNEYLTEDGKNNIVPNSPYGIAKLASELDIKNAFVKFGLNYTILRIHNLYGPEQKVFSHRNIVAMFMEQILNGKEITLYGTGDQNVQFTYIDDLLPPMEKLMYNNSFRGHTFNLGGTIANSLNQMISLIGKNFKIEPEIRYLKDFVCTDSNISHEKAKAYGLWDKELETRLAEGIEKTSKWFCQNYKHSASKYLDLEIEKNIPSNWKQ